MVKPGAAGTLLWQGARMPTKFLDAPESTTALLSKLGNGGEETDFEDIVLLVSATLTSSSAVPLTHLRP